ncbi:Cilia- and flagella-associated protein 44 [Borealophlyctis nickersoniae]|nr:Cilia- and flagella-associated protein 44 [Borealophlyctis nickersoniae]
MQSPVVGVSFSPDNHVNVEDIEPRGEDDDDGGGETEGGDEGKEPGEEEGGVDGKRAFVCLRDGTLVSVVVPAPDVVDNGLTYEIPVGVVGMRRWMLDVPEPKVVVKKSVAGEGGAAAGAQPDGGQQPPTDSTTADGGAAGSDAPAVDTIGKKDDTGGRINSAVRKARGLVIRGDSPVNRVLYLEGGYFLLALTNKDGEGEIRACKFGTPNQSRLLLVYKSPITDLRLSTSGKYLLLGSSDGMTCLRKFRLEDILLYRWTLGHEDYTHYSQNFEAEEAQFSLDRAARARMALGEEGSSEDVSRVTDVAGQYWFGHAHDSRGGRVNSVQTTFDDAFLCSAGAEGGLFVWRVSMEEIKKSDAYEATDFADQDSDGLDAFEDITDPNAYSLQESKIKAEKDKEIEDAEVKKQVTRDYIQELRNDFLKLVAENEKQPEKRRIHRDALNVDPDLRTDIAAETEEKIRLIRRELEWISEKESIGPNKLRKKFLDDLQTERIQIAGFKNNHTVATFRTLKLEQSLENTLQPLLMAEKASSRSTILGRDTTVSGPTRNDLQDSASDIVSAAPVKKPARQFDAKSKLEARKQLRSERAAMWKELMDKKPDENYEDPRDVAAIRYAEQHMGDYKLKTGEKYIVPESERVDADKKRRQILLLKESIYSLKEQFNYEVLGLREKKRKLVEKFEAQNRTLSEINTELVTLGEDLDRSLWSPTMEASAYPEHRDIVTPADLIQLQKEEADVQSHARGNQDDLMGAFGNSAPAPPKEPVPPSGGINPPPSASALRGPKSRPATVGGPAAAAGNQAAASGDHQRPPGTGRVGTEGGSVIQIVKSSLELAEEQIRKKVLLYRKDKILKSIDQAVKEFDASVDALGKERIVLEGDVKFADMKLLLLYREWVLLKEFEKYDNALADKLVMKRNEKDDIDLKIRECQEKLNGKKAEIELVIKREKDVQDEFHRTVGENNKYEEFLGRIFKKKIKRTKKKAKETTAKGPEDEAAQEEEEEDEEEENEDDDMSDYDTESNPSENDDGGEDCPPDCDPAMFNRVVELREKKLDQEDILVEIQKAIEALKKENDALIKKEKVIDMALKNTESEIQDFQTQKQQKLNELDVAIPLRLHQILFLDRTSLPTDLTPALVFVNAGLAKLRNRIKELQQEKADIRKDHKELRKMHVSLVKSRKEKQFRLQELETRAHDVQMLKFGQIIDLERLERMGVNRNADELREKLQKEDVRRMKELAEWDTRINELKESLTEIIKENTMRLEHLVDLTESQQRLEESLNASQSSVTAEYSGLQKRDILEREKLAAIVDAQSTEIQDLKREIELLIRKTQAKVAA